MKNKRVIVTGAAGFIGSHTVDHLLSQQCEVLGIDNFSTGLQSNVDRVQKKHSHTWECLKADIKDAQKINAIFKEFKPDVIVHLAAKVSVPDSIQNPQATHDTNVKGFLNVITAAKNENANRFIYASSSAVYGEQKTFPIPETAPLSPLSPYGDSKKTNEEDAALLATNDFQCIGLRFFNIFGPYQPADNPYAAVITQWAHLLKQGKPITIFGDGSATRDYCHVANVVEAISTLSTVALPTQALIYNIGNGKATTLNDLSHLLIRLLKKDETMIQYKPWRSGDILHSFADIRRAQQDWNYRVLLDLEEGLGNFLASLSPSS